MKINYLVIEGNIGAGKTTLAQMISRDFNAKLVLEQFADNPFLPKFYREPDKYSFPLEMSFLAERYNQLNRELQNFDLFSSFTVSDYYFMKSLIFAQNTLQPDEYKLYQQFFQIIYEKMPKPDLYVYLHLNTENLLRNIEIRGREYEKQIDPLYLEKIAQGYFSFFRQQGDFPIAIIDTNGIDFVGKSDHYKMLLGAIFKNEYKSGINRVLLEE
ncbi:MAG: deoxynucleoside kinase [Prolixibacteraceae bacterium]|jgi:deoxyadenosine/deoxycytidine kinase|nr:deoxynucleoside kinase [Prolixibacteraceae bacterium]